MKSMMMIMLVTKVVAAVAAATATVIATAVTATVVIATVVIATAAIATAAIATAIVMIVNLKIMILTFTVNGMNRRTRLFPYVRRNTLLRISNHLYQSFMRLCMTCTKMEELTINQKGLGTNC